MTKASEFVYRINVLPRCVPTAKMARAVDPKARFKGGSYECRWHFSDLSEAAFRVDAFRNRVSPAWEVGHD